MTTKQTKTNKPKNLLYDLKPVSTVAGQSWKIMCLRLALTTYKVLGQG